jgi:type II secretory pathway component PulJ
VAPVEGVAVVAAVDLQNLAAPAAFSAPSATELLHALGKIVQPRWRQYYRETAHPSPANRPQAALALGALLGDIVLAALARDTQHVRNLLQDIETLEKMLGVLDQMRPRLGRLQMLAEAGEWEPLRREADAASAELSAALDRLRDSDLATLVSSGTWLRALQLDADMRLEDSRKAGVTLALHGDFLGWLHHQWETLGAATREDRIVMACEHTTTLFDNWRLRDAGAKEQNGAVAQALGDLMNRLHTP